MEMTSKKPQAKYEPGELQKTRQNLGQLEQEEAAFMIKRLGGEIGIEKTDEITDETLKKVRAVRRIPSSSKKTNHVQRMKSASVSDVSQNASDTKSFMGTVPSGLPEKKYRLPVITPKTRQLFDKIMTSAEYNIRPAPGFFAMLFSFGRGGPERVSESFVKNTLTAHLKHIDFFTEAVQFLISSAPASYQNKINTDEDFSFRALKIINNWDTLPVKTELAQLKKKTSWVMIEDMVPFIRELYRPLIKLYFLGEMQMTRLIKTLYGWTTEFQADKNQKMRNLNNARQAASEWLYIFGQVIKGLYPLLMRMCTPEYDVYPDFFNKRISDIMPFLEITKYDIILPKKDKGEKEAASKAEKIEEKKAAEEKTAEEKAKADVPAKQNLILQSLGILEKLFPEAGFMSLAENPDMYSYFQPLYSFPEGFNWVSPQNPLQVTLVLLRIIEDFFQGCRHIPMGQADVGNNPFTHDNLQKVFADWIQYREVIFDKIMGPALKECVNQAYTQPDFHNSRYGKREISNWLWQEKYYFHPHLTFEISFIEKPRIDTGYTPLAERIKGLVQLFSDMVRTADAAEVSMPLNLSAVYHFDVENSVSYRLNLLLGGGKSKERTNLNLLKYTLCVLRVLDWWINDKDSLAYKTSAGIPYRTAEESLRPLLSVQLRSDQRDVFLRNLRIMHAVQKAERQDEAMAASYAANAAPFSSAAERNPHLSVPLEGESAALEKD